MSVEKSSWQGRLQKKQESRLGQLTNAALAVVKATFANCQSIEFQEKFAAAQEHGAIDRRKMIVDSGFRNQGSESDAPDATLRFL